MEARPKGRVFVCPGAKITRFVLRCSRLHRQSARGTDLTKKYDETVRAERAVRSGFAVWIDRVAERSVIR
jgi:hypothetical protein